MHHNKKQIGKQVQPIHYWLQTKTSTIDSNQKSNKQEIHDKEITPSVNFCSRLRNKIPAKGRKQLCE